MSRQSRLSGLVMYPAALADRYRADGLWGTKSIAAEISERVAAEQKPAEVIA
jgi:non-ribosomal peptide synthetase component E (peptide arylation enzyme)